ncbi:Hachiman antiphage defense system protein HamA [Aliarcobacter butzleri]|uniref:Hachiman antiphage defense system protein HamA n=1 Tax=Aliarcobacter butzleri TaxID=28197 RepID=UPI001EDB1674|nr:Hachiman antiphage defense system protein HamA [Aliarcobacter butzleri]MCG3658055.1 SAVED domain-containing protein [Aliarcobacter butzleri]
MNEEYNLNSIFIFESMKEDESNRIKGTCFSISKTQVLTAKHNIDDREKYYCYLDIDSLSIDDGIELEIEYKDENLDFVILKTKDYEFTSFVSIGEIPVNRGTLIKCCGYPDERGDYAPMDSKIDADYSLTTSHDFCFSIEQVDSICNYSGMSGSPIMYKHFVIGILIVQEGGSVLYGILTTKIKEKLNLTTISLDYFTKEEIEYIPPSCPPSPFRIEIDCEKSLPNIKGLNIGFDFHTWKLNSLVNSACEWIIDYTLTQKQINALSDRIRTQYKQAIKNFPFDNINAIMDLFLHISIRENYKTIPVINKLFDIDGNYIFSSSHVIVNKGEIEIWLGVSSISKTLEEAVIQVTNNIKTLITEQNLNERLILITEEHNPSWPFSEKLTRVSDSSLDMTDRFDKIIIPIFIANESELINSYSPTEFKEKFQNEIDNCRSLFLDNFEHAFLNIIDIRIFSFPIKDIDELHNKFIEELNND